MDKKIELLMTMKAARINAGISKKRAAAVAGISKKKLTKYERNNGKIKLDTAANLADLYGVPLGNMFFGSLTYYRSWLKQNGSILREVTN